MNSPQSLRDQLSQRGMVIAPGAYDAIGARLIEQAGFSAVYMTGAGTSAARGYPDFGLLTMSEMVENAAAMARAIGVPLIADADTGYGNELNVTRTVREFEARGVAAIHIEDQVAPKRCGHLDGKEVVSRDEFVSKIRAAVEARRSHEFLVIARTDARAMLSLDEAVWRANAALAPAPTWPSSKRPRPSKRSPPCPDSCRAPACSTSSRRPHPIFDRAKPRRWAISSRSCPA
jgi:2-methylisocitrate lyase-like PEP mutase family enzyme